MSATDVTHEPADLEPFRRAVHGLYILSLPDRLFELATQHGVHDATVDIGKAARVLAAAPVDRLLKLHAVASALNRKPALAERRQDLALVIAVEDRGPEFMAEQLAEFAREMAEMAADRGLSPDRWDRFLRLINEPRTEAAVNKPGCNDDEAVATPTGSATTIKSRFWTDHRVDELARFVDPTRWAICGAPFWRRMAVVSGTRVDFRRGAVAGYTADFEEIVNLPIVGEVTVYLRVEYGLESLNGQPATHVYTNYELAVGYPKHSVIFDSGWLCATANTVGPQGEGTLVEGLKAIRFTEPVLNQFPDLACDGGWVYLMINMALRCTGVPQGDVAMSEVAPPAGVAGAAAVGDGINEAIDDWVRYASGSVQSHGEKAKSAIGRVLAPRYDPRWFNDLLDMGPGAVGTTEATLSAWRRILAELAKMGGQG